MKTRSLSRTMLMFCALLGTSFLAQNAFATCPPGQQLYQGRCVPVKHMPQQAPHETRFTEKLNTTPYGARPTGKYTYHPIAPKIIDRTKVKPQPGAPIEHHSSTSQQHGIIFVGGKNTINSQPVPPGHSELNPQPIPPGHTLHKIPHSGTPIENNGGH